MYPTSLRAVFVILLGVTFQLELLRASICPSASPSSASRPIQTCSSGAEPCAMEPPAEGPRAAPVKSCCGDFHPADPPPAQWTRQPEPAKREQSKAE